MLAFSEPKIKFRGKKLNKGLDEHTSYHFSSTIIWLKESKNSLTVKGTIHTGLHSLPEHHIHRARTIVVRQLLDFLLIQVRANVSIFVYINTDLRENMCTQI